YLREICAREEGASPPVDLALERKNGDFVRGLILEGIASAVHDISDGGLLVALAEMAIASGIGAVMAPYHSTIPAHAYWFGEDQARYVITVPAARADAALAQASRAGVAMFRIGVTGGNTLTLAGERPILVAALRNSFEAWFPSYMAGELS